MLSILRSSPCQFKKEQTSCLLRLGLNLIKRTVLTLLLFLGLLQLSPLLQISLSLGILFRISFLETLQKSIYILQVLLQFLYIIYFIIFFLFYQVFLLTYYSNLLVLNIFNLVFNRLIFLYQFQGDSQYIIRYRFQQKDIEY